MTPEAKNLPSSITSSKEKIRYEPEQPLTYNQVITRAVIKPLRLGHHAVRDGQGKSVPVETGRGKKLKRPLPREIPVAILTDMRDPDLHGADTVRLSPSFAAWEGGAPVNINLRHPDITPALKRSIRNRRRSGVKIIA